MRFFASPFLIEHHQVFHIKGVFGIRCIYGEQRLVRIFSTEGAAEKQRDVLQTKAVFIQCARTPQYYTTQELADERFQTALSHSYNTASSKLNLLFDTSVAHSDLTEPVP